MSGSIIKNKEDIVNLRLLTIPSAQMYEKSYMHRDTVSKLCFAAETGFLITASLDGHVKLWRKQPMGIEFVRDFRAHLASVDGLAVSCEGKYCATVSASDESIKVFDIIGYDLTHEIRLNFLPSGALDWCSSRNSFKQLIAVAHKKSGEIDVFDVKAGATPVYTVDVHNVPVTAIRYNEPLNIVISTDQKGLIEYWQPNDGTFPQSSVSFCMKVETNLFDMAKRNTFSHNIDVSPDGEQFIIFSMDKKINLFKTRTGKITRIYDESLTAAQAVERHATLGTTFHLESIDFGRRVAYERIMEKNTEIPTPNAIFDESGEFIIYSSLFGLKIVNIATNKVVRLLGKMESTNRFSLVALFQNSRRICLDDTKFDNDPTLVALSHKSNRFYLFTRREPKDAIDIKHDRDIFNEKPLAEEIVFDEQTQIHSALPRGASIHTSYGQISIRLFAKDCPRTVENFVTHAKNRYFDGLIFHRVIKGFIIQTGDPLGNGTGGQSIWGGKFEDEITKTLCHNKAGTLSMANAGPNSNGSQFFITAVPCPWLDGKHTVFGDVSSGLDVVLSIERAKVDRNDKPDQEIKILHVEVEMT